MNFYLSMEFNSPLEIISTFLCLKIVPITKRFQCVLQVKHLQIVLIQYVSDHPGQIDLASFGDTDRLIFWKKLQDRYMPDRTFFAFKTFFKHEKFEYKNPA